LVSVPYSGESRLFDGVAFAGLFLLLLRVPVSIAFRFPGTSLRKRGDLHNLLSDTWAPGDRHDAVRPDTVRALGMRAWYLHEKNDPRAVIALIHAADAGDAWSEHLYGSFLIAGTGVPKDERLGNRLQREATAMGFQPGE
jgi:hypothetical protein